MYFFNYVFSVVYLCSSMPNLNAFSYACFNILSLSSNSPIASSYFLSFLRYQKEVL